MERQSSDIGGPRQLVCERDGGGGVHAPCVVFEVSKIDGDAASTRQWLKETEEVKAAEKDEPVDETEDEGDADWEEASVIPPSVQSVGSTTCSQKKGRYRMYPTELRQLLQSAFAVELRGHVTRDGVIARLKKRGDVYQAMALHHGLPVSSNMLLKKITDCIRHMSYVVIF